MVEVCLKCFQEGFDESSSLVKTVLKRKLNFPEFDLRDHQGSGAGKNKLKDDAIELVRDQINNLPNYESHYARTDSNCKYFHADLCIAQMYKLHCKKYNSEAISMSSYAYIFKGK